MSTLKARLETDLRTAMKARGRAFRRQQVEEVFVCCRKSASQPRLNLATSYNERFA